MKKTNAARILDRLKINYELKEYKVDLNDLSAVHVATEAGMNIKTVFKTLVARSDKNDIIMACIPGDDELDLKKLAKASNHKKNGNDSFKRTSTAHWLHQRRLLAARG